MKEHKIMVCGSRSITDRDLIFKWIENYISNFKDDKIYIIEGEARGVDSIAKDYALINHYDIIPFPANWSKYGRAAGIIRNEEMVKACDACLIIWDGTSKGTKNDIDLCKKYHKAYAVIVPGKVSCDNCRYHTIFEDSKSDNSQDECIVNEYYAGCRCLGYSEFSYDMGEKNIIKL